MKSHKLQLQILLSYMETILVEELFEFIWDRRAVEIFGIGDSVKGHFDIKLPDKTITLSLWKMPSEHYTKLALTQRAAGAIIFIELAHPNCVVELETRYNDIKQYTGKIPIFTVLIHAEKPFDSQHETIFSFVKKHHISIYEISPCRDVSDTLNECLVELGKKSLRFREKKIKRNKRIFQRIIRSIKEKKYKARIKRIEEKELRRKQEEEEKKTRISFRY